MERPKIEHVEEGHASSLSESSDIPYPDRLSAEHREYLLGRHGTLDFSPVHLWVMPMHSIGRLGR